MRVALIIPALNEEDALPGVLSAVPKKDVDEVVVVDNGSVDDTAAVAERAGARVVHEKTKGYGAACLAGVKNTDAEVFVFMDGDGSFSPDEISTLTGPILRDEADFVLGTRTLRPEDARAIAPHARLGNWLIAKVIRSVCGVRLTDLGPFRAIPRDMLDKLGMEERTYGWPCEMIIKAGKLGCRVQEVLVSYRPRSGGKSKVSGSIVGSIKASLSMLKASIRWSVWVPPGKDSKQENISVTRS